jgi:hypothetical protein
MKYKSQNQTALVPFLGPRVNSFSENEVHTFPTFFLLIDLTSMGTMNQNIKKLLK